MCVLQVLLLLVLTGTEAVSGTIITTLPGFNGTLPITLETGYVGVGELEDVQLFYCFVESQRNPAQDPLLLTFCGGPGCSSLFAFFYESGPLYFEYEGYRGGLPILRLNQYAWTQHLNIIYLDAPVGTGFSYSRSEEGYYSDDYKSAKQTYEFLRKWLKAHPKFLENNLYIGGESYAGMTVPIIAQEIIYGNEIGRKPSLNFKGIILGDPVTDEFGHYNARVPFAHRLTLISDELYKAAKENCNGDYVRIDPSNVQCQSDIEAIEELIKDINIFHVLHPFCAVSSPKLNEQIGHQTSLRELRRTLSSSSFFCLEDSYVLGQNWANNETVREALHVRPGTKGYWQTCNSSLAYTQDIPSTIPYHQNLTSASLRVLIFSGDHDMSVPNIATERWIKSLNLTISDTWRAWFVDGQVAGYTRRLTKGNYALTYATVKGAGHNAPVYKMKECYTMVDRWLAYYPL